MSKEKIILILLRLSLGLIFLWAFIDKLFGLGFATKSADSWLHGGSPTTGYLSHAVKGPFADFFMSLAGHGWVDWLFMLGLLFVGLTLIINKYVKLGALAGIVMLVLMWISAFPPANNPFLDDHVVYALVLAYLAVRGG